MYPYDNYAPGMNGLNNITFQSQLNKNEIVKVQGKQGAMNYPLAPAGSVLLLDVTQDNVIWCKTTDAAGFATIKGYYIQEMPEENNNVVDEKPEYARKSDVDTINAKLDKLLEELK